MEYYVTQPKDYWIAQNAVNITLNALGDKNRIQCSVVSGAVIMCFLEDVKPASQGGDPENGDGLYYGVNHEPKRWPLSISPTYFNTDSHKYVYVAIPRSETVGTQAVIVFPSEELDIYGRARRLLTSQETGEPLLNEDGEQQVSYEQIGSTDYFYIYLNGIISAPAVNAATGREERGWERIITDWGKLETAQGREERQNSNEWFSYSQVNQVVTFLKEIIMGVGSSFRNLILNHKNLTDVATSETDYTDSDTMVATPGYVEKHYLSKSHDDSTPYSLTVGGILRAATGYITSLYSNLVQSTNYTGDGIADTGYRLTANHNGHSKLTIDEIYVRMKAVFESLEVRERTYAGGDQIWSCAGNRINRVDYLGNVETADHAPEMMDVHADGRPAGTGEGDVYSVPVPGDTYGYSYVKVPWLLRQMPFLLRHKFFGRLRRVRIILNEQEDVSGRRAGSTDSQIDKIRRARCYFLAKDDDMEVHNWWRINDLARCQTMNLANTTRKTYLSGEDQKAGNIFWWRKVIGVSYDPVKLDDGKEYHYFDVAFDYLLEQEHPEEMATSVMEGSDIPAAQDSVVQFGNTIIEGRMNLMMMEVNGGDAVGYGPTTDAPCLKAYRGIYCFDLNKCWVGGSPRKMMLSPKSGYEFYGPNFKQVTEYDVVPVPVERGLWLDIVPTRDDYREHAMVRKCYYYDKVSHNGSYWLCSIVDGAHWVDGNGDYISDATYSALTEAQKALCSRKQNYTIEEPSADSIDWTEVVKRGSSGNTPAMLFTAVPGGTTPDAPVCTANNYMNNTLPQGWSKSAPNRADDYNVWMSQNTVMIGNDGAYALENVNWSAPTRISGDKGDPGADADDREYIYIGDTEYRSVYADSTHTHPKDILQGEVSPSGTAQGGDTNKQQDDWVPNGWSDTAIATNDSNNKFVYMSWRDKASDSNTWGNFHDPILWSNWGVQGIDGDGVQYVFKLYADKLTSAQEESFKPTKGTQDASGEWSANNSTVDTQSGSWQDDAPSATENLPYCYCSVIKRLNGTWGNFETLGLWSRFSKDGKGQPDYIQTQEAWSNVESVASETTEPTPNGGWSDTTPANTNNYAYLWRRSRKMVLQSDGTYAAATGSDGQWKYTRLSGTNGTSINTKGTIAVAIAAAGTWPTTGVTANDLGIKQGDATIWKFNGTTWVETATESADGDSYTVTKDCIIDLDGDGTSNNIKGHLLLWSDEAAKWIDLGQFKGDAGTTYYTHVAWGKDVTLSTSTLPIPAGQTNRPNASDVPYFSVSPLEGYKWMGILINTTPEDPTSSDKLKYTWQNTEGQQGPQGGRTGTVYLYKRSATAVSTVGIASTLYYKFATKKLYTDAACTTEATTQLNGWSLTIPAGTDPIYVTAAIAYSETESDDIGSNEWVTPALFTGEHGINSATIFLYKRSASVPTGAAATPSQTLYYKFSDGKLYTTSALTTVAATELNGWSLSMPATDGNPCYIIQVAALSTDSYDPIATTDWSGVRKALEDGKGQPDYIQTQEAWSNVESVASETTEPTPNGGWSDTTPANTNNYAYLWRRSRKMVLQSDGTYAAATGSDGQWKYTRLSGTNGTSISVKGTVATVADLNNISNPQDGDAYVVSANGHLYLWSSEAGAWIDLGEFKGDPGTTYYTHIAWASAVTKGTTPSGHTTTGQTTTPNATSVTDFHTTPFTGAAWMGVLINTLSGEDSPDALSYTWNEVKGPQGDQGEQGEGGYGLSLTPTSLILESVLSGNQELVNYVNNVVTVRVMKGSTPVQLTCSVLTGTSSHSSNISISSSNIPVYNAGTYSTVTLAGGIILSNGESGFFTVQVSTGDGKFSQNVRINFYVNRATTFTRQIKNGIETAMGAQTEYSYDQLGGVIKTAYQADIQTSAKGLTQQFTEQISRAGATGANLFGFHNNVVFDTYAVPFIQGYGFVCNNHWNAQDKTGRVWNLGMHGRLGYYTVRCLVKTSNSSGYVRLQMNWHDAVAGTQVSAGIKGVVYATTSEWRELTATFLFNDKNESHIGTTVPEGQSGSYEIGDINGYIDIGQITGSNNGTRISVSNNRIYVRHLKVEYKDIATDFCEADEDVAYLGQGNVAKNLDFRPYRTEDAENQTVDGRNGVYRIRMPYLTNTYPWGDTTNSFRDYLVKSDFFNLEAGKCYTLSFWAKSSVNGFIITQHLYKGNYSIINSIGNDIYVDPSNGTIQESIMSDGQTQVKLSTTWTQYFVHFYVANNVPSASVIPLRVFKSYNNSSARNLAYIYMSDIELQEGYVTPADYFASFINQNARRISLVQQSGTKLAGIDIQNGTVNLMGDRVIFSNSTGTVSGKVWIDPDNGTIHATDGKFSGEVTATGGSITGYLNVTGGLNVKNSGGSTVVQVNGSDVSKTSSNDITIVDAEGFYVKRGSEGFRLTTIIGFQRWNSSANNGSGGWVNFYGGRYVRTVTSFNYTIQLSDDLIIAKPLSSNKRAYLPKQNVPDGKIITIINAGAYGLLVNGNGHDIIGASVYDEVALNINDRMEFIYSLDSSNTNNSKWYANFMPKVDNES